MTTRHLILLSPYRYPAQQPLTLTETDMASWLSGYSALWHPAALRHASAPPRMELPHLHESPKAGHIYAIPNSLSKMMSQDWEEQARAAGTLAFRALPDREATLANLKGALATESGELADLHQTTVAPFFGIGLGFLLLSTLSEAMEHENLLAVDDFWIDIQRAVANSTSTPTGSEEPQWLTHLQSAAKRLLVAREALYPVTIHLLDMVLLEEQDINDPWPVTVTTGQPINVISTAATLERLKAANPAALTALAEAMGSGLAEVCGGDYLERPDVLLPVESQLWNLRRGLAVSRELLGFDIRVYARRRFGAHPQLPDWLGQHGIHRAVLLPADDGGLPAYSCPVMNWSTQDGQETACFMRKPLTTDSAETFFNLGHHLFKTTREDHTATLAFVHQKGLALPWYDDLLELSRLALVAGQWTIFTHYFDGVTGGEYAGSLSADDFRFDYLTERITQNTPRETSADLHRGAYPSSTPVSGFSRHARLRRRLDTCFTLAALLRGLAGPTDSPLVSKELHEVEDALEAVASGPVPAPVIKKLEEMEKCVETALSDRLLARAHEQQPGYLLLNPCSFTRRVAIELPRTSGSIPIVDPVKAVQADGDKLHVVAEVPGLGFAWFPQAGRSPTCAPPTRMRLADDRCVRNEYFEAEIDPATGGLRAIRDHKTPVNRVSQRLIFRPGSAMKVAKITTTSTGPVLGEILTEGALLGNQDQVLAKFRQRFRAWIGRPILDLRIELFPEQPPAGDPWHAYFAAQFAWRDERALLLRGVNGTGYVSTINRPQTPDYLEIRQAHQNTTIFPCGLPFHQREGGRMLDVILVPPGEPAQVFDLAIGLNRELPMQTALGLATPATVVATSKGPPHIGPKGWLFHLDAPNLLMTSMRPGSNVSDAEKYAPSDAIVARLLECCGISSPAQLRCPRDPQRVILLDGLGQSVMDGTHSGDAAMFHIGPGGLIQLQVEFTS